MPKNTLAQAVVSSRLLRTNAPSREIGANRPPCLSIGARHANSASEPPMKNARMTRMKRRDGDRWRKRAPRSARPSGPGTSRAARAKRRGSPEDRPDLQRVALFHHGDRMQKAVPASQGISEAFSTGIPEPEAAPAQCVIGPIGAHRYAERQEAPGDQREGRTKRANAASIRPSIRAAAANENTIEKPT